MQKLITKGIYGAVILVAIALLILGFLAYFVSSFDKASGTWSDGLGRTLVQTPALIRLVFGEERLYPGWKWFILDMIVFWGVIAFGAYLVRQANRRKEERSSREEGKTLEP